MSAEPRLPDSKKWLVDGFIRFTRRMVAKRFNAFGIQLASNIAASISPSAPLVVYANHAGWWDPITAMLLRHHCFPNRTLYAPIDADALANYRIMAKLGFYGVKLHTFDGASHFLATTKHILQSPDASVWITPEGKFCDVRDHSQPLMPGLSHLAYKTQGVVFLPLALEYSFWNESRPQIFARFGQPLFSGAMGTEQTKEEWNAQLTHALRQTQEDLARCVIARDSSAFEFILASRPQRLGWYDYSRSWVARIRGQKFDPRHMPDN